MEDMQMGRRDILEAIDHNQPKQDVVKDIERSLEIDTALNLVNTYRDRAEGLRSERIPLFSQSMEIRERIAQIEGDIEMEVMLEYPPRKGSEKQRDLLREKLRFESEEYQRYSTELNEVKEQIAEIEFQERLLDEDVKHARRKIELHAAYLQLVATY